MMTELERLEALLWAAFDSYYDAVRGLNLPVAYREPNAIPYAQASLDQAWIAYQAARQKLTQ